MKLKTFSVEFPGVEEVKPYFRNSKIHTNRQIKEVAQSIRRFGFDQPVVVDPNMVIIKGHGRYFAAISLKLKNIPVIVRDDLSSAQIKGARIADNKIFEMTTIDLDAHAEEMDSISSALDQDVSSQDFMTEVISPEPLKMDTSADYFNDDGGVDTPFDIEQSDHGISDDEEWDEELESVGEVAPELEGGKLLICPKCIHSFYVQKG